MSKDVRRIRFDHIVGMGHRNPVIISFAAGISVAEVEIMLKEAKEESGPCQIKVY